MPILWFDYTKFTPEALETNRKLAEERRNKIFTDIEAETSLSSYAGYAESSVSIILHKIAYVILWLLSYGLIAYAVIRYELDNKADFGFSIGIVTIPMLFVFFGFAISLFSQLKTGKNMNYFIHAKGVKHFRVISVVYAVMVTITTIALYILLLIAEIKPSVFVLALIGAGLLSVWIIVVMEKTRSVRFSSDG